MWPFKRRTKKLIPHIKIVLFTHAGTQITWDRPCGEFAQYEIIKDLVSSRINTSNFMVNIDLFGNGDNTFAFYPDRCTTIAVDYYEQTVYV